MIKVFVGGEGTNDIGTRWYEPMGDVPGVAEVLLRRARPAGWEVAGARRWKTIRKYRAGGRGERHADAHNVLGLVLEAYENACEMLAFVRDGDGDELREQEIHRVLDDLPSYGFAESYRYELVVVGGVPKPKLEGWILCLLGVRRADAMSSAHVDRALVDARIAAKTLAAYVEIAETGPLPSENGSLAAWLRAADASFRRLIDGDAPT